MSLTFAWERSGVLTGPTPSQVNIMACSLEFSRDAQDLFWPILSEVERTRADRFAFEDHRARYIACRGFVRKYLGLCLSVEPKAIVIESDPNGKPRVVHQGGLDLRFNLSHSKELAVFAFAVGIELGIDVEFIDSSRDILEISSRYFSRRERSSLEGLPGQEQAEAFFRCWTRKEAYLKARGDGLYVPLDGFDVSVLDEPISALTSEDSSRWVLFSLKPAVGYAAALALENHPGVTICSSVLPLI